MNGDLARRGTCLCLVCAHPHPYPLIIIIILGIVIFVTFVTIIIGNEWLRCATHGTCLCLVCPPTPWKVQVCLTERPKKVKGPDTYYKLKESARELSQFDIFTRHWKKKQTVSSGSNVSSVSSVLK